MVTLQNTVEEGEYFAPSGITGGVYPHLHLALSSGTAKRNPLYHLEHPSSSFHINILHPRPIPARPIGVGRDATANTSTLNNLVAEIDSSVGLDLNRVEFRVETAAGDRVIAGYDYGGAPSSTTYAKTLTVTPVDPLIASKKTPPGYDRFSVNTAGFVPARSCAGKPSGLNCVITESADRADSAQRNITNTIFGEAV